VILNREWGIENGGKTTRFPDSDPLQPATLNPQPSTIRWRVCSDFTRRRLLCRTLEVSGKRNEFYCTRLRMPERRIGLYPVRTTWHRAVFYCRLSLRESSVFSIFRRAKSDSYFPHDAWKVVLRERSTRHLKLHTVSHAGTKPRRRYPTSRFALRLSFLCALCGSLFVSIIDHEKEERNEKGL